jgi:hypothetical protein
MSGDNPYDGDVNRNLGWYLSSVSRISPIILRPVSLSQKLTDIMMHYFPREKSIPFSSSLF